MTAEGPTGLDVIGSDPPVRSTWWRRLPTWCVAVLVTLLLTAGFIAMQLEGGGGVADEATAGGAGPLVPPSELSRTPDVAIITLSGQSRAAVSGARGSVRFEVRNGGPQVRVISLDADVPGVRFSALIPPNGVSLPVDAQIKLALAFEIEDCGQLVRTGRVLLQVTLAGQASLLGRRITAGGESPGRGQIGLDPVWDACPR